MKSLYLFLLMPLFTFSQASLGFKSIGKGQCKVEHTCRAEYKEDSFENTITYKVGFYETRLSSRGLSYIIMRQIKENKEETTHMIFFAVREGCNTSNSYVHIQFKNGEKLKLPTSDSRIDCGTSAITVDITNHIETLLKEPIEKIRVAIEFDDDFDVTEKGQKKFFANLECIGKLEKNKI